VQVHYCVLVWLLRVCRVAMAPKLRAISAMSAATPVVVPDIPNPVDYTFFDKLCQTLAVQIETQLPAVADDVFVQSLQVVQSALATQQAAQQLKDTLAKQKPVNQTELDAAVAALADASTALDDTLLTSQTVAVSVLENLDFVQNDDTTSDSALVVWLVVQSFGAKRAAAWCNQGDLQRQQVQRLLQDVNAELPRTMLLAGGALKGEYGRAMQLYDAMIMQQPSPEDPVLERLALAVALELCAPLPRFVDLHTNVDPLQRYVHYEQAFLFGELDPAFSQFTVQELRMAVNSDAPDDQLGWGRESLQNYRPDLVYYSQDAQWRYCRIVKTDVPYRAPVWYKPERSYDQILSGGGKCGPRAWYGRFACKAFGIPVWGVKQPGHAAMARWTTQGWMTCLGAGFAYSNWNGRTGNDFLLETQARSASPSEQAYLQKVMRIEWMAQFRKESDKSVRGNCLPDAANPWWALSWMERKLLSASAVAGADAKLVYPKSTQVTTKLERFQSRPDTRESMIKENGGKLIIPAATCSDPTASTKNVLFMDSFLGGQQLHWQADASVEYTLATDLLTPTVQQYNLTCRICTVHRDEKPLLLTVGSDSDDAAVGVLSIEMPYTMGMWQETAPVVVELGGPHVTAATLTFARQTTFCGISIKDIQLTPI